jgi:hypothetical protein
MRRGLSLPAMPAEVARAFDAFPEPVHRRLLMVRRLIFAAAGETAGVGALTETLKWGEPAYLTETTKSGSTIRLGRLKGSDQRCAVLFNCRTTLIEIFRSRFSDVFWFEGNRAIVLDTAGRLPEVPLIMCLSTALAYHRRAG